MRHGTAGHQMAVEQTELPLEGRGEAPSVERRDEAGPTMRGPERSGDDGLMEQVVERSNLARALRRVRRNQGSAGIDGMTVDELLDVAWMPRPEALHWLVRLLSCGAVRLDAVTSPDSSAQ